MKLDLDCIRDILIIAEGCGYNESLPLNTLKKRLPQYRDDAICYNCLKLYEAGYIDAMCIRINGEVLPYIKEIMDITYPGHQLLAKIRDEEQWRGIKKGLSVIRDYSLSAITAFADGMTSAAISAYFSKSANR